MARRPISVLMAFALSVAPALAEDLTNLTAPEIAEALTGRTLDHDGAWQDFRALGRTLYNAGSDSSGPWTTQGHQYCSQWPPNASWTCFLVAKRIDGKVIRFSGVHGALSVGGLRKQ